MRACVTFLPFFSVNWFLSVLAFEDTATTIFQYIYAIANTILGILIFMFQSSSWNRHMIHVKASALANIQKKLRRERHGLRTGDDTAMHHRSASQRSLILVG